MTTPTILIVAQLVGTLAILIGIIIAVIQVNQIKKQRKELATIEFLNSWQNPEIAKAINAIQFLPDRVLPEVLKEASPEMEQHAFIVHSFFESAGILVKRQIISFEVVDNLVGGVVQVAWTKLELWIQNWRNEKNPIAGEWFEWLKEEVKNKGKSSL